MKYNTMFDVAFSLDHCCDDPYDVDVWDLIVALEKRLIYLRQNINEAKDAFGVCDTYEHSQDDKPDFDFVDFFIG